MLEYVLSNGVHEMRLAQPHATVDEERVVRPRRRFGDGTTGGMGKLIRGSYDEAVEAVTRIQPSRCRRHRGRRGLRLCLVHRLHHGWRGGALGEKNKRRLRPVHLGQGLGKNNRVVLREPVLKQGIRHSDRDRRSAVGHQRGWLKPSVEAVPVNLCFDPGEDLVPDGRVHERLAAK